ncbi:sugar phosphate isomerase/epimerase [Candidatus Poribacteria bacterium]|nr:sugar phosphate isomerase/epimerase [Candidatus Poribacteria bacterium]
MNASMYEYMRIGVVHFMAFPDCMSGEGPILETVTRIAEDPFFNAIEITSVRDDNVRRQVKAVVDVSGMALAYAAQPVILSGKLNLNALDEDDRIRALSALRDCVDEAVELGAKSVAILSGPDPGELHRERATAILASSLQDLCDYAHPSGIGITLETFDRTIDKRALIGPSEEAVRLAELVNRGNFGLLIDLSHLPLQFESPYKALHTTQPYLVHAHIGNCVMGDRSHPAYGDLHPHFGIAGGENGVDEVAEFLQVLLDIGYLEPSEDPPLLSFEVKALPGQSAALVLANAKRTLIEAWARL